MSTSEAPTGAHIDVDTLRELNALAQVNTLDSLLATRERLRKLGEQSNQHELVGVGHGQLPGYLVVSDANIASRAQWDIPATERLIADADAHPVDRIQACVAWLSEMKQRVTGASMAGCDPKVVQQTLSRLVIDNPVLFDSHVLFGAASRSIAQTWAPLAGVLAWHDLPLPETTHGIPVDELVAFAALNAFIDGVNAISPLHKEAAPILGGNRPLDVARPKSQEPLWRDTFVPSLLRLNHAVAAAGANPPFHYDVTYYAVLASCGAHAFWDAAIAGGAVTGITREVFVDLARSMPAALRDRIADSAANHIDRKVFDSVLGKVPESDASHDVLHARAAATIALAADARLLETKRDAAAWLSSNAIGAGRPVPALVVPGCTFDGALGFMDALWENGVAINFDAVQGVRAASGKPASENELLWRSAFDAHTTRRSMSDTLNAARAKIDPAAGIASTPRRPRGQV